MHLNVLAVTSWGGACGIANYAQMLQAAIQPRGVELRPSADLLDPGRFQGTDCDVLWLNYHAGLHSRWTPDVVLHLQTVYPALPLVITYHDTYDGVRSPNSDQAKRLAQLADVFIVHEPVTDIADARVIRQGIPRPQVGITLAEYHRPGLAYHGQPVLGTAGFDFPWKNFTRLAEITAEIGWAYMCVSHDLTWDRREQLRAINPHLLTPQEMFHSAPGFFTTDQLVALLSSCTATAWMYECANSGTSGAIRLGLAALRPCYALRSCRQFRDLLALPSSVEWVDTWADLKQFLSVLPAIPGQVETRSVRLYATDSWNQQAAKYLQAFEDAIQAQQAARLA